LAGAPDELAVSTPMRLANIIRLNEAGVMAGTGERYSISDTT